MFITTGGQMKLQPEVSAWSGFCADPFISRYLLQFSSEPRELTEAFAHNLFSSQVAVPPPCVVALLCSGNWLPHGIVLQG